MSWFHTRLSPNGAVGSSGASPAPSQRCASSPPGPSSGSGLSPHLGCRGLLSRASCQSSCASLLVRLRVAPANSSNPDLSLGSLTAPGTRAFLTQKSTSADPSRACTGAPARTASPGTCASAAQAVKAPTVSGVRGPQPSVGRPLPLSSGAPAPSPCPAAPLPALRPGWALPTLSSPCWV